MSPFQQLASRGDRAAFKMARKRLREENRAYGDQFTPMAISDYAPPYLAQAWRSKDFLVQLYLEPSGFPRLSVNRTDIDNSGMWVEGITWEELQRIKEQVGFADKWAVECYPPASDVVNVANMRHLFILNSPPAFGWKPNAAA